MCVGGGGEEGGTRLDRKHPVNCNLSVGKIKKKRQKAGRSYVISGAKIIKSYVLGLYCYARKYLKKYSTSQLHFGGSLPFDPRRH